MAREASMSNKKIESVLHGVTHNVLTNETSSNYGCQHYAKYRDRPSKETVY
jgi:hypothetical protein